MACFKNLLKLGLLVVLLLGHGGHLVHAQSQQVGVQPLRLERQEDGLWLSTQLGFELPGPVVDALQKGIAIFFVAEADLLQERWYWRNKVVSHTQRHARLAYQPLIRRWRVNVGNGEVSDAALGLSLNQTFDTLEDALATLKRVSHWKIAEPGDIEPGANYLVDFRFYLDLTQLPRPLQIGTLGQSDWSVSFRQLQALDKTRQP